MADLAPAGAEPADLADREGREVVVQHEAVAPVALDVVEDLLVEDRAQRGDAESLGLAAREEGRAVGALEHADLAGDRPDVLEAAAVDAEALVEDAAAKDLVLQVLHEGGEELLLDVVDEDVGELGPRILDSGVYGGVSLLLDLGEEGLGEAFVGVGADLGGLLQLHLQGRQGELFPCRRARASLTMRAQISAIGFLATSMAPSISSSEASWAWPSTIVMPSAVPATTISSLDFLIWSWVGLIDVRAVEEADAHAGDGPGEGDVGDVHRRARGDEPDDVRRHDAVEGDAGRHDLELAAEGLVE